MNIKTISWSKSKLVLLGSVMFLSSFFFGGQASAANCTWTNSSTDGLASTMSNWDNGSGGACATLTGNNLMFSSTTSTNVSFDIATTTGNIFVGNGYTGSINVSAALTAVSSVVLNSGSLTISGTGNLSVGGNLEVSSTAFSVNTGTLTVTGNTVVTSTLSSNNGAIFLNGNLNVVAGGSFVGTNNASTYLDGSSNTVGGEGNLTFYNLIVGTGDTYILTGNVTTTNDLTINSSGNLNLSTYNFITSGNIANSGTISQSSGTVTMNGSSKNIGGDGDTTFYNLLLNQNTGLSGNVTTTNNLTVESNLYPSTTNVDRYLVVGGDLTSNGAFQCGLSNNLCHLTMTGNGKNINLNSISELQVYEFTVANGATTTIVGSGKSMAVVTTSTINGILNVGDQTTLNLQGSNSTALNITGVLNTNTSTILFNGASQVIPSLEYYNLTLGPSAGETATFAGNVTSTNLTVNSNSVILNLGSNNLAISGNLTNTAGTITQSAGTVTMSSSSASIGGAGNTTLYNLLVTGTSTLAGNVTSTGIVSVEGVLNGSNKTLKLTGNSNPLNVTGIFNTDTGTVVYSGVSNIATNTTYYSLEATGTQTIPGNVTVGADFSITGSANQTSGTVTMTRNASYTLGGYNSSSTFNNLVLSSNGVIGDLIGNFTINNTLTSVTGTLNLVSTSTVNFLASGTPFVLSGAINPGNSTITYSGATSNVVSTTYYNLVINSVTSTLLSNVTTTNILTINSGKKLVAGGNTIRLTGTGIPFVNNGTFTANTSTVIYSGAGTTYMSATSTYYNLEISSTAATLTTNEIQLNVSNYLTINTGGVFSPVSNNIALARSGTPFVIDGTFNPFYSMVTYSGLTATVTPATYYNLVIDSSSGATLGGNVTTTNFLQINTSKILNGGSSIMRLTGSDVPFVQGGTFNAGTSEFIFSNTGAVTVTGTTYYKLTLGTGTYTLGSNATTTNTFTNGGSFIPSTYYLVASGTYTNNGTVTGISHVKKQATGAGLSATSYTSGSSNGTGNTVTVSITDPTANANGSALDTLSVTLTASNYSDSEAITLTETGVATGEFSGTVPFNIISSKTDNNSKLDVSGNGTLALATYSNGHGAAVLTNSSASYTGSTYSSGGGSGGGSAPLVSSATSAASVSAGKETTSQSIVLSLSATNATQVAISEDPGFAGASWEAYAPTKSFTLSKGAGEKTIYVKFRSDSGGVTAVYKTTITLKDGYVAAATTPTAAPVAPVVVSGFVLFNPDSKVVIAPVKTLVYKPNSVVKYTYSYKNETVKTLKIKVARLVVDAKGKVVHKVTGSASITKGKTFKFNASSPLSNKVTDGAYTVKVQVLDFKTGKMIDENGFGITVKKPVVKAPVKAVVPVVKKK